MSKIRYVDKRTSAPVMRIVEQADAIIDDYRAQGLTLTVRQLYYRFIALDLLPDEPDPGERPWIDKVYNAAHGLQPHTKNTDKNYKRIAGIVNDARLRGFLDWTAIQDRTRALRGMTHTDDAADLIDRIQYSLLLDLWEDQRNRVEVWVEKQALEEVIQQVANEWDCNYFACRGYPSQSAIWRAAERFKRITRDGQNPVVLYLGDHDPSGLNIDEDLSNRFGNIYGVSVEFRRIALTMPQIEETGAPPNPAKLSDSRAARYIATYGTRDSWELDALEPAMMKQVIGDAIQEYLDPDQFEGRREIQVAERKPIAAVSENWDEVLDFMEGEGWI